MKSKFLTVNEWDFIKGGIVATITGILTTLVTMLDGGLIPSVQDLRTIAIAGISAGVAYILKNIGTNSKGEILKPEEKKNVV